MSLTICKVTSVPKRLLNFFNFFLPARSKGKKEETVEYSEESEEELSEEYEDCSDGKKDAISYVALWSSSIFEICHMLDATCNIIFFSGRGRKSKKTKKAVKRKRESSEDESDEESPRRRGRKWQVPSVFYNLFFAICCVVYSSFSLIHIIGGSRKSEKDRKTSGPQRDDKGKNSGSPSGTGQQVRDQSPDDPDSPSRHPKKRKKSDKKSKEESKDNANSSSRGKTICYTAYATIHLYF